MCISFTKTSSASLLWKTASVCCSENLHNQLSPSLSSTAAESVAVSKVI